MNAHPEILSNGSDSSWSIVRSICENQKYLGAIFVHQCPWDEKISDAFLRLTKGVKLLCDEGSKKTNEGIEDASRK